MHLVDTSSEKSTEGSRDRGSAEKDGRSESALSSAVPESNVIVDTTVVVLASGAREMRLGENRTERDQLQ